MKISTVLAVLAVMVAIQAVPIPDGTCTEKASAGAICGTNPGGSGGDGGDGRDGPDGTDPDADMYEAYSKREVSAVRITEASRNPVMVSYKRADKNGDDGDKEPEAEGTTVDGDKEPEAEGTTVDGDKEPEAEGTTVDGDKEPEAKAEDQGDKDKDGEVIDEDF